MVKYKNIDIFNFLQNINWLKNKLAYHYQCQYKNEHVFFLQQKSNRIYENNLDKKVLI